MPLVAAMAAEDLPHQSQEALQNPLTQRGIDMCVAADWGMAGLVRAELDVPPLRISWQP
jgi:hypothetical protein